MIRLILLFLCCVLALFANTFLEVQEKQKSIFSHAYIQYLIDKNNTLDFQRIKDHTGFKTLDTSNFGYKNFTVWTKLSLKNSHNNMQELILQNPFPEVSFMEVWIVHKTSTKHYTLGSQRDINLRPIKHRYHLIPLKLNPKEEVTVFTKIHGYGALEANWILHNKKNFYHQDSLESILWGIFAGIVFALIAYNLFLYRSLKDKFILIYVLQAFMGLIYQYGINGLFYHLDFGLNPTFLVFSTWITSGLGAIVMYAFLISFLNTKQNFPRMHKVLITIIILLALVTLFYTLAAFFNPQWLLFYDQLAIFNLFYLLFLPVVSFIAVLRGIHAAWYLFLAQGALVGGLVCQNLWMFGAFESNFFILNSVMLGTLIDILLLALAITSRVRMLKEKQEKQEKLLLANARFTSVGQTVGKISHQWRRPISHLGSQLMNLELLLETKASEKEYQPVINSMYESMEFMGKTIEEFNEFYKTDTRPIHFGVLEKMQSVQSILREKLNELHVEVKTNCDKTLFITGFPYAFTHIILILLENTLTILEERGKEKSQVLLYFEKKDSDFLEIRFEDFAGGIKVQPLEKVFDFSFTNRLQPSSGMGLAMLKNIVEERFQGSVAVSNTPSGARFTLLLKELT